MVVCVNTMLLLVALNDLVLQNDRHAITTVRAMYIHTCAYLCQCIYCATPMNILTETSPEIPKIQNRKTDNSKVAGPCRTGNSDNSNYWSTSGALFVKLPAGPSQSCRARVLPTPVAKEKKRKFPKLPGPFQSCRTEKPKNRKPEIPIIQSCQTGNYFLAFFVFLCFCMFVFLGEVSVSMFIGAGQCMQAT